MFSFRQEKMRKASRPRRYQNKTKVKKYIVYICIYPCVRWISTYLYLTIILIMIKQHINNLWVRMERYATHLRRRPNQFGWNWTKCTRLNGKLLIKISCDENVLFHLPIFRWYEIWETRVDFIIPLLVIGCMQETLFKWSNQNSFLNVLIMGGGKFIRICGWSWTEIMLFWGR